MPVASIWVFKKKSMAARLRAMLRWLRMEITAMIAARSAMHAVKICAKSPAFDIISPLSAVTGATLVEARFIADLDEGLTTRPSSPEGQWTGRRQAWRPRVANCPKDGSNCRLTQFLFLHGGCRECDSHERTRVQAAPEAQEV